MIGTTYRVLLVEKRPLTAPPEDAPVTKCCGGLLAPDAQRTLSEMGLGLPKEVLVGPQLFVVRAIDLQRGLERYYQRHYINLDRERFDRWLVSLVPDSVELRMSCLFVAYEKYAGGFALHLRQGDRQRIEHAILLIGADGASSAVRKQASPTGRSPRKYIGIQEWFEVDASLPYFSALFDPEITDFYCWTIPKEGHLIVGAALSPMEDAAAKFREFKEKLGHHGFKLGRSVKKEASSLVRPMTTGQLCPSAEGVPFLGEAGGWISASSAEGISFAFRSALLMGDVLKHGLENAAKRYVQATGGLRRVIWLKAAKARMLYNPRVRSFLMGTGIRSISVRGEA